MFVIAKLRKDCTLAYDGADLGSFFMVFAALGGHVLLFSDLNYLAWS